MTNNSLLENGLIGQWKVIYMGGIPGFPGILGKTRLCLYKEGFSLSSDKLGKHVFPYNRLISWDVIKERSSYASANSNAFFKPRHIRIEYIDQNRQKNIILLEMVQSIFLPTNAKICQEMLLLMKNHGIFNKFCPSQFIGTTVNSNIYAQIEQLSKLHQSGALTDEEFQKKKEELLKRI